MKPLLYKKELLISSLVFSFIFFFIPINVFAAYLTSPLNNYIVPTSWFDHTSPQGTQVGIIDNYPAIMTRYDGTTGWNYNGHAGSDFPVPVGTDVIATAPGEIQYTGYDSCGGFYTRIWHSNPGHSTYYFHLNNFVVTSGQVTPGQLIAHSGDSGDPVNCVFGAHLHFEVRNGQPPAYPIDPFGWFGNGQPNLTTPNPSDVYTSDPWPYNQGYLWTTNPPSLTPPPPATSTINVSGNITSNTTWTSGNVYVIQNSVAVNSGVTLTIEPGTVVKFDPQGGIGELIVNGSLVAQGTVANKIYFTSFRDDSVGGDTNGDGNATIPQGGDFSGLVFNGSSTGNITHSVLRYGSRFWGYPNTNTGGMITNSGGSIVINNSVFSQSLFISIMQYSGSIVMTSSLIIDPPGVRGLYASSGNVTITNNIFNNLISASYNISVQLEPIVNFSASGNQILGAYKGYHIMGSLYQNQNATWNAVDFPYLITGFFPWIQAGSTLTIQPGTIIKFLPVGNALYITGFFNAQGISSDKIYFTSIYDDSVGGDTNNDGSITSPAPGDYFGIIFSAGSSGVIDNVVIRYAGLCCFYGVNGSIINNGGTVNVTNTRIINNNYGIYNISGATTISQSSIHDNTSYGIYSGGLGTTTAQNNWWGSPTGPYHQTLNPSGAGNQVSNNVNFNPWLTYDPNLDPPETYLSPCNPLTGC